MSRDEESHVTEIGEASDDAQRVEVMVMGELVVGGQPVSLGEIIMLRADQAQRLSLRGVVEILNQ